MTVAALDRPTETRPVVALSPHTRRLLQDPIVPMLLRMAWPNILIMVAQAATGLIETWWIAHLGTDALAGMALVFPPVMLMQMVSAGAMGGGISAAIARALGRGRRDEADALVMHAVVINIVLGLACSVVMLAFGRPIYRALGGAGGELEHGALWHAPGGYSMRHVLGEAKAIVSSTKKVGPMGCRLDVPVTHINASYVRSHFDAMEVGMPDAPRDNEMVVALVMSTGPRIHARAGGLKASEIKGEDGLR